MTWPEKRLKDLCCFLATIQGYNLHSLFSPALHILHCMGHPCYHPSLYGTPLLSPVIVWDTLVITRHFMGHCNARPFLGRN